MKHNKAFFLLMILFLLLGSIQVDSIFAHESDQAEPELSLQRSIGNAPSFGMNFHSDAFADGPLTIAQAANNHWVRYNGLRWSEVQPSLNGDLNWEYKGNPNQYLIDAYNAGMEVILIIRSTPGWAQKIPGASCGPMREENIPHFADLMKKVLEIYSKDPYYVKYYEIWNEPDDALENVIGPDSPYGCWGDPTDDYFGGGYYAQVLKAVHPAVKRAHPDAQVVLGGLLLPIDPDNTTITINGNWLYSKQTKFFEGILRAGGGAYFDVLNFHGFTLYRSDFPSGIRMEKADPVNNHWWMARGGQVEGKLGFLKETMARYNVGPKPIMLSEAGLPLSSSDNAAWPTWSPDKQIRFQTLKADYVTFLYTRNIAVGIDVTTWYHFFRGWRQSGILDQYGNRLEAYDAYKGVTTALAGANFVRRLNTCGGLLGFEFQRPNGSYLWVLFSEDGAKSIQLSQGNVVFDYKYAPLTPPTGRYTFTRPTYIEFTSTAPILPFCTFLPLLNR
jgi:hypothetical protein